ncbi:hypothetical protein FSP39_021130 [Pinctada imbricata]|uniref:STI1/HOP DP domain-containing protein n=1 Tax=Pinctada imbricata TaxID=66713 RepID=A0AA88Y5Q0_PINIB|nr:hypothetical protein FSP39_021130 [Pinctada imbricata]
MEAINMFQSNPSQAMERYKHDVEVQEFFKKFMGLMGEHFTNIADKEEQNKEPKRAPKCKIVELDDVEEKKDNVSSPSSGLSKPQKNSNDTVLTRSPVGGADMSVRSSTNPKQPTADDEKRMQEILSDPEIRNILMDQKIFGMIEALRRNPSEGQRIFETADNETKRKIQKLVQCGLLQFQT